MIRLERVRVQLAGGRFRLDEISLEVAEGGYSLVIGPTGCGKTTLLEAIAGHLPLAGGRIWLGGRDVTGAPPEARGVGFVYQHYHLFPHYTVRENIAYGLKRQEPSPERREARVRELAELLDLSRLLDRGATRLSGGEQQRVALARALAPRPGILLLDEPLAAVDPASRRYVRRELLRLRQIERTTTLQVTHDFEDALRLGDSVAVLAEGRIVQQGPPEEVFRAPNSAFVAEFIGSGNVLPGLVERPADAPEEGGRFSAVFRTGPLLLEVLAERAGPCHAVIRPEDIVISRERLTRPPRNVLEARVVGVERASGMAMVHLDAGVPLVASVTPATAREMILTAGQPIFLAIKATAIHLI